MPLLFVPYSVLPLPCRRIFERFPSKLWPGLGKGFRSGRPGESTRPGDGLPLPPGIGCEGRGDGFRSGSCDGLGPGIGLEGPWSFEGCGLGAGWLGLGEGSGLGREGPWSFDGCGLGAGWLGLGEGSGLGRDGPWSFVGLRGGGLEGGFEGRSGAGLPGPWPAGFGFPEPSANTNETASAPAATKAV